MGMLYVFLGVNWYAKPIGSISNEIGEIKAVLEAA